MNKLNKIVAVLCLTCVTVFAYAANTSFLSHSAFSFLTKDDLRILKAAQNDALNHYKDGQALTWSNPKTGSHGTFSPYHTTYQHGELCRKLKILSSANLVHEKAIFRYCRQQDKWKIM